MTDQNLQWFFGGTAEYNGDGFIVFDPFEVFATIATDPDNGIPGDTSDPRQVVAALLAMWTYLNYKDFETDNRLSQDKSVPIVSQLEEARRTLSSRESESQVRHDYNFSVYTQDNTEFNPTVLVGNPSDQGQGGGSQ